MRATHDEYFLGMLALVASRATCARRRVAAILVDAGNHILATGYNGPPRGFAHCTDTPCAGATDPPGQTDRCLAIHAEVNAVLQCRALQDVHTIYTSVAPCFACAKMLANTNLKRVVCLEPYADGRGLEVLSAAGIAFEVRR